ncbi:hypothetical protein Tco_0537903, partial [Tanacetum coccineum]
FHMAQQIISAAQLVPKFQSIGRCNNYDVLQSIPCSPECNIVGHILLDHPLSYALTATADVPALDSQEITYTIDMFRDTIQLPMETLDNPFIASVNIKVIESFMQKVGYQGVVDKVSAFYTKFLDQPWQTMSEAIIPTTGATVFAFDMRYCQGFGVMSSMRLITHVCVNEETDYGYLEEIVVRRADNALYGFEEGDFPQLRINDIEDMLLLVSLVIQRRVKDLQLGVESYQKQINVTKPDTTRPDLRKRHPDGTLTRLLSSLEDITKNIDMDYLPKRRWSNLEKKIAHFMIKDINKLLKERRMMRSLEKFVGGRLYGTDLRLLQRTI